MGPPKWNESAATTLEPPTTYSDCMGGTECELLKAAFIDPNPEGGVLFSHCGEHEHSVVGPNGLEEEGKPVIVPWMEYILGKSSNLDAITSLDGWTTTCKACMAYDGGLSTSCEGDADLNLFNPDSDVLAYLSSEYKGKFPPVDDWATNDSPIAVTNALQSFRKSATAIAVISSESLPAV